MKRTCGNEIWSYISVVVYELLNGVITSQVNMTALASVSISMSAWYLAKGIARCMTQGGEICIYECEEMKENLNTEYSYAMKTSLISGIIAFAIVIPVNFLVTGIMQIEAEIINSTYSYLLGLMPYVILGNIQSIMRAKFIVSGNQRVYRNSIILYNITDIVTSVLLVFVLKAGIISIGLSDTLGAVCGVVYMLCSKSSIRYVKYGLPKERILRHFKVSPKSSLETVMYSGVLAIINWSLGRQGTDYVVLFAMCARSQMILECIGKSVSTAYRTLYAIYYKRADRRYVIKFEKLFRKVLIALTGITAIVVCVLPLIAFMLFGKIEGISETKAYMLLLIYFSQFLLEYKAYTMQEKFALNSTARANVFITVSTSGVIPALAALCGGYVLWSGYIIAFTVRIGLIEYFNKKREKKILLLECVQET